MNLSAKQEYLDKDSERKTNERTKESEDSTKLRRLRECVSSGEDVSVNTVIIQRN